MYDDAVGRPTVAVAKDQPVRLRMTPGQVALIDRWAERESCSRAEAIRRLVRIGMHAAPDAAEALSAAAATNANQINTPT